MRVMLTRHLPQMGDLELAGFADRYRAAQDRAHCWPLVEAITVAFGHYGDDVFSDVQDWLICQGEQVYRQILANPDLVVEFLGGAQEEAFTGAQQLHMTVLEELNGRPEAAKLRDYRDGRQLPWGMRSDLADTASVHARYPRCAASREKYLNSQLPSIALPKTENDGSRPTRRLTLGATWHSRRQ